MSSPSSPPSLNEELRGDRAVISADHPDLRGKSASRIGMRVWLEKAVNAQTAADSGPLSDYHIGRIYRHNTVKVSSRGVEVSATHPVRVSNEATLRTEASHEIGGMGHLEEYPGGSGTAGYFAKDKTEAYRSHRASKSIGVMSRFSFVSRKLRGGDDPESAMKAGWADRSYKRIWKGVVAGAKALGQAKIMTGKDLGRGRTDAGVVYAKPMDDEQVSSVAQELSTAIKGSRSYHVPFGMTPAAKGVAFAETLDHTDTELAPGYRHGEKVSSSFGTSRTPIIKRALATVSHPKNRLTHAQALDEAIGHYGYDVREPARVDASIIARRKR